MKAAGHVYGKQNYRAILRAELNHRRRTNAAYSQRAYARDLGIPAHRLSEILNGKQGLSPKRGSLVAERLNLTVDERLYFVDLVRAVHARSAAERAEAKQRLQEGRPSRDYRSLELATLQILSDWLPFAILEYLKTNSPSKDLSVIAQTFGVTKAAVAKAVTNLKRVRLLEIDADGWRISTEGTFTGKGVPSRAIKNYQRLILARAETCLYREPLERREFSSIVVAIERSRFPLVKDRIREFVREIDAEFGRGKNRDAVACLALQLFMLSNEVTK